MDSCGQCLSSPVGHKCLKHAPCFLGDSFTFSPSKCDICIARASKARNGDKEAMKQWKGWLMVIKNKRKFGRKLPIAEAVKLWVSVPCHFVIAILALGW